MKNCQKNKTPIKVLLIPSSGEKGSGETLNAIQIINFLSERVENISFHIALHKNSPFIKNFDCDVILTEKTPTDSDEILIPETRKIKPNFSFFIGAGSSKLFRASKKTGSFNIFISYSKEMRARGLKLNRIMNIDFHLVDQYESSLPKLRLSERIKCLFFNKSKPHYLGPIFQTCSLIKKNNTLKKYNLTAGNYILVSLGSGGDKNQNNQYYNEIIHENLCKLKEKNQIKVLHIFGKAFPLKIPEGNNDHICIDFMTPNEFICLLESAKFAIINGGGTLSQAISLNTPTLSCAITPDQPDRVNAFENMGLTKSFIPEGDFTDVILSFNTKNIKENLQRSKNLNSLEQIFRIISFKNKSL
ncbi:hypothetical protein J3998_08680 [Thiomicrorhabdus sp. 6S2-11]|uniref:Glycosyl transferase family 28 C-terminal domain-containing protein n=1 Tax=Thiomicrorhabdus marina TaxID=2818442 RepID=A0ABS3Q5N2_9GAMM|nr:hypothetical protein [Thiomicrorhabdus marina]MBO1927650.1 hypothetical protein [Thiomicrorhabdus marina]